jgi:predicted hydrocarbon binding protein
MSTSLGSLALSKNVNVMMFGNNRRFFEICIGLKNVPGALGAVSDALAKSRLNVLSCDLFNDRDKLGTCCFFVEPLSDEISLEETKSMLETIPFVEGSMATESFGGLIVDSIRFPFKYTTGDRAMILRSEVMRHMTETIIQKFGSGGEVILYELGKAAGQKDGKDLVAIMGVDNVVKQMHQLSRLYSALGWGLSTLKSQEPNHTKYVVQIKDSFEVWPGRAETNHSCTFIRGHISGFLTEIFGSEYRTIEMTCQSRGDSCCEFAASRVD